jgi:hypothetical protein
LDIYFSKKIQSFLKVLFVSKLYETIRDSDSQSGNPSTLFQSFASPWDSNFESENPLENVEIHSLALSQTFRNMLEYQA